MDDVWTNNCNLQPYPTFYPIPLLLFLVVIYRRYINIAPIQFPILPSHFLLNFLFFVRICIQRLSAPSKLCSAHAVGKLLARSVSIVTGRQIIGRCMTARDRLRAWDVKKIGSSNLTHKSCCIFVASRGFAQGFAHCIGTRLWVFHNFFISL